MASQAFLEQAYLAYFGRPVDPVGAYAFQYTSEADVYTAFYESAESRSLYGDSFGPTQINAIYQMLFGRDAEPAGIAYWSNQISLGLLTPAGAALGILNGALNQDAVAVNNKLLASHAFTAGLDTLTEANAYVGNAAAAFARDFLKTVTTLPATGNQVNTVIADLVDLNGPGVIGSSHLFTLQEAYVTETSPILTTPTLYWGYNPHPHTETSGVDNTDGNDPSGNTSNLTNEGPLDGGVEAKLMKDWLLEIAGVDLTDLLNALATTPSSTITINNAAAAAGGVAPTTTLNVVNSDGGIAATAQVVLSEQYFKLLQDALFDSEGNSRLYMKDVVTGGVDAQVQAPIVLTPYDTNGGTVETNVVTTATDDLIVAGRLELLHQAYIDGGAGRNTLEVDAKGIYAQPLSLKNIQEVRVNDLPNFYTSGASGYPNPSGNDDSWLDLNRAVDIDKLVVTDQGRSATASTGDVPNNDFSGNLTIVGVRNAATLRLEGGFQSGTTTIQYGQGQTGTLNVELALGDVSTDINLLQNASTLNIDSQGVENHMHSFFAGGSITRMNISGAAVFAVDENLAQSDGSGSAIIPGSFNMGRPVLIDANANTGGVDLTVDNHQDAIKFIGTNAGDEFSAKANNSGVGKGVTITGGTGNNIFTTDGSDLVAITSGDGNDIISATGAAISATISAGGGTNNINADGGNEITISTGSGNDTITARDSLSVVIEAGDGKNNIVTDGSATVEIITGVGNDTISSVDSTSVTINAGDGNNTIVASGSELTITTGAGNDTVTLVGKDAIFDNGDLTEGTSIGAGGYNEQNSANYEINGHFADALALGAVITLDLGAGTNTLKLGRDADLSSPLDGDVLDAGEQLGITALEGSSIVGTGIKLYVENNSDLTQADLTGATFTAVQLKQELRITAEQFTDIGSAAFSVVRDEEGATEDLYVVVNSDATLSDLVDLATLSTSVRLHFELHNGATLTLSAAELHKHVAHNGIDSTDGLNGKVVITDAGLNFDPFDNGDDYQSIDGGSLTDSFATSDDVTVIRSVTGYERPTPGASTDTLTIDSDVTPVVTTAIISEVATLKIIGAADISFDKPIDLGRDTIDTTHLALADGRAPDWAAPETDAFTIDFSALTGMLSPTTTIANFQDVKQIKGNGTEAAPVRLNVELTHDSSVGTAGVNTGLKSTGVQTYVVTHIGDDSVGEDVAPSSATFYVCDLSADVTTLGLRGNYNDTINFLQVKWGTNFLLEAGDSAKADGNPSYANIGNLHGEYFWTGAGPHANATVAINNAGVALTKPISVASIDIDNADSITINATDGDVMIGSLSGNSLNALTVTSADDVSIGIGEDLLDGQIGNSGAETTSVIDGTGVAGDFVLNISGDNDFSEATLSGIDALSMVDNATTGSQDIALTLSADQVVTLGALISNDTVTDTTTLNVNDFSTQLIDFTTIDVDTLGTVTVSDSAASPIIVDAGTVFGNFASAVTELAIVAKTSDTTIEMTAAQFGQLDGAGTVTGDTSPSAATNEEFVAKLVLTAVPADAEIVLTSVDAAGPDGVSVVVRAEDIVATEDFSITGHAVALEVTGTVDLTAGDIAIVSAVDLAAGAVLTLTAAQVLAIGFDDLNGDDVADAWSGLAGSTLHITELSTELLDLDLVAAAGINIGTLTLVDSDTAITLNPATTLGGADAIVTPTAGDSGEINGIEDTSLTLSVDQFAQLDGVGTITGDATVNLYDLVNNTDTDGLMPLTTDTAVIDVSGITAPKGTVSLGALTVTLDPTTDLAGFEVLLTTGQMIRFSTAVQADGQVVTEVSGTTAIAWLFDTLGALTEVDTSNYDADINTLYILEDLVDGVNEESLWTTLAESIVVEKVNVNGFPDVLVAFDRINTFEALTAIAGVTYDDTAEFSSIEDLTINLEGNTNIGTVLIGDSVGESAFQTLTINSYEDRSTLTNDNGFTFQPNMVGDITITNPADTDVTVTLNTFDDVDNIIGGTSTDDADGFLDKENVNGMADAERDGLALEVGTITFAAVAGNDVSLVLTGANDITIAGLDITADPDITLLKVDASDHTGDLEIGSISPVDGVNDFDFIYLVNGHTAEAGDVLHAAAGDDVLLVVEGGANDFTEVAVASFEVDAVHFTADATLTLTADQVAAIGTADGPDTGTAADAWSIAPGVVVTLNIVGLDGTHTFNLNAIQAAGINIGEITVAEGATTLAAALTLGGADMITIEVDTMNSSLELTANQYQQIDGTIEEELSADAVVDGFTATVIVDELEGIENAATGLVTIDLSTVNTTGGNTVAISDFGPGTIVAGGDGDVELTAAANLAGFSITLNDIDSAAGTDNELAGETIRLATAVQAEREIIVTGEDANDGTSWTGNAEYFERDTNVVWLFDTIVGTATAGKIDTSDYDEGLGRVWVNDVLVDGQNVESIFSSPSAIEVNPVTGLVNLNSTTIIRVVNTADLGELLPENNSVNRTVEIESFTQLPGGLIFSNPDKLVDVQNLTLDLGGALTVGDISIDDIVAAAIANDNTFDTLTINSLLADVDSHYLLPESWDTNVNPLPSELAAPLQVNTLGDISSGATRDQLANVTINATGTGLNTGTITFAETTSLVANPTENDVATLKVTGDEDVNITSVNTADVDIATLNVVTTGYTGTLTAPGASPAFLLNNTETLTFDNGNVVNVDGAPGELVNEGGVITLGTATNAGVAGDTLSVIDASDYDGELNLGIVAQIDGTNDDSTPLTPANDGLVDAFTFTSGAGLTTMTLAAANGLTPTLAAGSEWSFDYTNAAMPGSYLKITPTVTLTAGSTLRLNNVPLVIEGAVSLTQLVDTVATPAIEGLIITGGSIQVLEGSTLTLSVAQVLALTVDVTGSGTVIVTGDATDAVAGTLGQRLKTVGVDLSAVTLVLADDADDTLAITLPGAVDDNGDPAGYNVVGSVNIDSITTASTEDDAFSGGLLDDTLNGGTGANTFTVTSGTDTIVGLDSVASEVDILLVSAGATALADVANGFTASAATVNNGSIVLTAVNAAANTDNTLDVSVATGANGFTLIGGSHVTVATADDGNDILIGGTKRDVINGGNSTQETANQVDTLTGNGGEDSFVFDIDTSNPYALVDANTIVGQDKEQWEISAAAAEVNDSSDFLTVTYRNGTTVGSFVIVNDATIDFTDVQVLSERVATELSARGLAAVATDAGAGTIYNITVTGTAGQAVEIVNIVPTGVAFATNGEVAGYDAANDVEQENTVTVTLDLLKPLAIAGEIYTLTATPAYGDAVSVDYVAVGTENEAAIALALATAFNTLSALVNPADPVDAVAVANVITLTDTTADTGGFTVTVNSAGGVSGTGASALGAGLGVWADVFADTITDFASTVDEIHLGIAAGTNANYLEAGEFTSYNAAYTQAGAEFTLDTSLRYYLTSIDGSTGTEDATGLLFFDANGDQAVDGVVLLTGVASGTFDETDILL